MRAEVGSTLKEKKEERRCVKEAARIQQLEVEIAERKHQQQKQQEEERWVNKLA